MFKWFKCYYYWRVEIVIHKLSTVFLPVHWVVTTFTYTRGSVSLIHTWMAATFSNPWQMLWVCLELFRVVFLFAQSLTWLSLCNATFLYQSECWNKENERSGMNEGSGEIYGSDSRCFISNLTRSVPHVLSFMYKLYLFKYDKATVFRYLEPVVKNKNKIILGFLESFILACISGRSLLQTQMHWKKQISNSSKGFWLVGLPSRKERWG